MTAIALVLAGAAFAVATVALLVGIRAYDVVLRLQAVDQNPQSFTPREPVRLHLAAKPAVGNFESLRASRQSAGRARSI